MQTDTQSILRERIQSIVGHPILVPVSYSEDGTILPFDPHALPAELMSESPSSILKREIATHTAEAITTGLLELFNEGAATLPTCKPYVRSFVSTRLPDVIMAAELPCGSWECKKCGPKLKLKWYLRQVAYMADIDFLEKIYVDKEDWQAVHRMINRQGEKYLKYEQEDGSLLLLTTARIGGTEVPLEEREYELVRALVGTAYTRQPVSQSRNWDDQRTTDVEQEEEQANWMPLDSLRYNNLDDLIDALRNMGIPHSPYSIYSRTFGSMRAAMFRLPEGKFWDTLWKLGGLARHQPTNGAKETRDTQWEWDPGPPN